MAVAGGGYYGVFFFFVFFFFFCFFFFFFCLFCAVLFPQDVLEEILDLIESVSEGFSTYSLASRTS